MEKDELIIFTLLGVVAVADLWLGISSNDVVRVFTGVLVLVFGVCLFAVLKIGRKKEEKG